MRYSAARPVRTDWMLGPRLWFGVGSWEEGLLFHFDSAARSQRHKRALRDRLHNTAIDLMNINNVRSTATFCYSKIDDF